MSLSGGNCGNNAAGEVAVSSVVWCLGKDRVAVEGVAIHGGAVEGRVWFGNGDIVSKDTMECIEEWDGYRFGCG